MRDSVVHVNYFLIKAGSVNTDVGMLGPRDLIPYRTAIYILASVGLGMAYYNFEFFYEAIRHVPGPHFHAVMFFSQSELVRQRSRVGQRT
jgi:hypothetical protein